MTKRDRIGVIVFAILFAMLCVTLVWTVRPKGESRAFKDSVIVQQRMKNIEHFRGTK